MLHGTKDESQEAGFGVDCQFPGGPGGNKRQVTIYGAGEFAKITIQKVSDFDPDIGKCVHRGTFEIWARYIVWEAGGPGRKSSVEFAPCVRRHQELRFDRYASAVAAMIECGLVSMPQLPGRNNCGKVMTLFLPDGSRIRKGAANARNAGGAKCARKFGNRIAADVVIEDAEQAARYERWSDAEYRDRESCQKALARRKSAAGPQQK